MIPRITLVGRPNVGKSSLFNAITKHKIAIVSDIENTTRDLVEFEITDTDAGYSYILTDSGGLVTASNDAILKDVRKRVEDSIERSDIILFLMEYDRITTLDEEIAKLLRKSKKNVIVVANKADNPERALESYELLKLGFGDFVSVSVVHRRGIDTLREKIGEVLEKLGKKIMMPTYDDAFLKLAIVGRPNVGKSSLINAIIGENRVMVRDMPGTTRDSVDTLADWNGEKIVLIDTAGIRRAGKIGTENIEDWSVIRSERAIGRSDVVALVMDGNEGVTAQDKHILSKALEAGKGIILVVNKWDLVLAKPQNQDHNVENSFLAYLKREFDFLSYVTPVFTSAIENVDKGSLLDTALGIRKERQKRVKTSVFNSLLEKAVLTHAPTGNRKSHKPKIYYGSQVEIEPPKFVISVNNAKHFHFSYKRYLENTIREHFGFFGTPIFIELKSRESMFEKGGGIKKNRLLKKDQDREDIAEQSEQAKKPEQTKKPVKRRRTS